MLHCYYVIQIKFEFQQDTYYAPVHIRDSYQIIRLTFVSLMLLIDYCTKTLTENVL